jgi:hypothetical protein
MIPSNFSVSMKPLNHSPESEKFYDLFLIIVFIGMIFLY